MRSARFSWSYLEASYRHEVVVSGPHISGSQHRIITMKHKNEHLRIDFYTKCFANILGHPKKIVVHGWNLKNSSFLFISQLISRFNRIISDKSRLSCDVTKRHCNFTIF